MEHFRIHGDNVVECERIINYLTEGLNLISFERDFASLSCLRVRMSFEYRSVKYDWSIELFPGFNKSNRARWSSNVFDPLKDNGSFLDETPDAIITRVDGDKETILFTVEFCSALQAGNQAWQRSGRAYSVGRAGCPYIYIVDFVKYELDTSTRERKALRFPNPAVPYSYISFSKYTGNFIVQAYVKAEEFQPEFDPKLRSFDEDIFADKALSEYMILKMLSKDTAAVEEQLLNKNALMVEWLSKGNNKNSTFDNDDWQTVYETKATVISHSLNTRRFRFIKSIAEKSTSGKSKEFSEIIRNISTGMASRDLPFGLIPSDKRSSFTALISKLYNVDKDILSKIADNNSPLVICMIKGFKPRGDDNRPDRGILPLVVMLSSENAEVMTFIYGPLLKNNFDLLCKDPGELAKRSGFWRVFLALSDYFVLDVPLLPVRAGQVERIIYNTPMKKTYTGQRANGNYQMTAVSTIPNTYHEDDVDTVIHSLFSHILPSGNFEGMCNPPGGDWSGMSVVLNNKEYRWLSLPRVSTESKRPDHVIEMFGLGEKPILLVIESKDRKADLENSVGVHLKAYLKYLFSFTPSVERPLSGKWEISNARINEGHFNMVSAGAYISNEMFSPTDIFKRCQCDMVFALFPNTSSGKWDLRIYANTPAGETIKKHISDSLKAAGETIINMPGR